MISIKALREYVDVVLHRVEKLEELRLVEFNCPNCSRLMIARQKTYNENNGGTYCFGCGKTFNKMTKDVYTEQRSLTSPG